MNDYIISKKEVLYHMKAAKDVTEYRRWQVIDMVRIQKIKKIQVAKILGIARFTVYLILKRFDCFGPEGMITKLRGGRSDAYMSLEEEKALLDKLFESGEKGLIITAKAVREAAEQKFQKGVSKDYAYDLLHRHGWRKIKPRPKHPKSSKETQEEFKKKFHSWSKNV